MATPKRTRTDTTATRPAVTPKPSVMAAIQAGQAYLIDNTTGKIRWPNEGFTPNPHD